MDVHGCDEGFERSWLRYSDRLYRQLRVMMTRAHATGNDFRRVVWCGGMGLRLVVMVARCVIGLRKRVLCNCVKLNTFVNSSELSN